MKYITFSLALLVNVLSNAQINERFDDITTLTDYLMINSSDTPKFDAFQGDPENFNAFEGNSPDSYIALDFLITNDSIIDYFIMTPKLLIENGDVITFYTRSQTDSTFPDRLEVRIGDGTGVLPTEGNPDNVDS